MKKPFLYVVAVIICLVAIVAFVFEGAEEDTGTGSRLAPHARSVA